MTLYLDQGEFKPNLIETSALLGGVQYKFKFDNNYGASVIKHFGSYGHEADLWELAVLKFDESGDWHLCYNTPITDDVIGSLTDSEVRDILQKIKEL